MINIHFSDVAQRQLIETEEALESSEKLVTELQKNARKHTDQEKDIERLSIQLEK